MQRMNRTEVGDPNMMTLLPFRGDMEKNIPAEESLTGMNIIMKLNNEQIFALLSSYASDKVKLRVVIKDGKINGLRVVSKVGAVDAPSGSAASSKKVEIIKCNIVKETNGTIYHTLKQKTAKDPAYAVNMGTLDYRLNLINYKPTVSEENVHEVANFSKLVKIVECIASTVGAGGRSNSVGVFYDAREVVDILTKGKHFSVAENKEINEIMKMLKPRDALQQGEDIVEWKWFRLTRSFDSTRWMKKLFQEGYRSKDAYTMLYSGRVDADMVCEKSKMAKAEPGYADKSTPPSPATSSKSSVISSHSRSYSRSNSVSTSESRHSTPPGKEDAKDVKEVKDAKEVKDLKKTKRSFKEYRLAKGLDSGTPSTPASPQIAVAAVPAKRKMEPEETALEASVETAGTVEGPATKVARGPRWKVPETDAEAAELVRTYQRRYGVYFRLYQELKNVEMGGGEEGGPDLERTNGAITELVEMQNELESIRWGLGVYSRVVEK